MPTAMTARPASCKKYTLVTTFGLHLEAGTEGLGMRGECSSSHPEAAVIGEQQILEANCATCRLLLVEFTHPGPGETGRSSDGLQHQASNQEESYRPTEAGGPRSPGAPAQPAICLQRIFPGTSCESLPGLTPRSQTHVGLSWTPKHLLTHSCWQLGVGSSSRRSGYTPVDCHPKHSLSPTIRLLGTYHSYACPVKAEKQTAQTALR